VRVAVWGLAGRDREAVTEDSERAGVDPFDALDAEAARLERFFAVLSAEDPTWSRPSRSAGWSVWDVLAHLMPFRATQTCRIDPVLSPRSVRAGVARNAEWGGW
jgi:Mycothiol maleylpyruvate isomerase N-terminal domain